MFKQQHSYTSNIQHYVVIAIVVVVAILLLVLLLLLPLLLLLIIRMQLNCIQVYADILCLLIMSDKHMVLISMSSFSSLIIHVFIFRSHEIVLLLS